MKDPGALVRFARQAKRGVERGRYPSFPPPKGVRPSLRKALERRGVVAEIKPSSPLVGPLRRIEISEVLPMVEGFFRVGALGASVVTSEEFGGSPELLREASQGPLPTLMKDFLVDRQQLLAARTAGSSAVLLILDLVEGGLSSWKSIDEAVEEAHSLGLEVLLEFYDSEGYERALQTPADLLGYNRRDLRTLGPSPPLKVDRLRGEGPPLLALSRVRTPKEAQALVRAGFDGVLVGETLMRSKSPVEKVEEFVRSIEEVNP